MQKYLRFLTTYIPIVFGLWASSAFAYEEFATDAAPGTVVKDARDVGWQWHYIDENGDAGFMEKTAQEDGHASYKRSDGCIWTRPDSGFAPAVEWRNCPSSGTADVSFAGDSIWPLQVGNRFAYTGTARSSLSSGARKLRRSCQVTGITGLKTVAGSFTTFKVVCKDRWTTRTWWLSSEVGTAVLYRQETFTGRTSIQEMTKVVFRP
ncbi:MAG: hypothetical protein AAF402_15965 [Pseudomonadota bacterium]